LIRYRFDWIKTVRFDTEPCQHLSISNSSGNRPILKEGAQQVSRLSVHLFLDTVL
jgi:hypothetical protein